MGVIGAGLRQSGAGEGVRRDGGGNRGMGRLGGLCAGTRRDYHQCDRQKGQGSVIHLGHSTTKAGVGSEKGIRPNLEHRYGLSPPSLPVSLRARQSGRVEGLLFWIDSKMRPLCAFQSGLEKNRGQ